MSFIPLSPALELHSRFGTSPCNPWRLTPSNMGKNASAMQACWQKNDSSILVCPGGRAACYSLHHPELPGALASFWTDANASRRERGAASHGCTHPVDKCAATEQTPGLRPCSRSQERQESFALNLAATLGVTTGGTFLEMGGHDGLTASNSVHMEYCRGWKGLLIEPNYVAFARLLHHRPGALAVRGAVCATRGHVTFAVRRAKGLARRGVTAPAMDLTGGIESMMAQTFEKAGYSHSAPTAWLKDPGRALRFRVPCAPLGELLTTNLGVRRVDIMWLDVEGGERLAIEAIDWSQLSVGILIVEMRYNDAKNNKAIYALLKAAGFELVRALPVWDYKIMDNVFLRVEHFIKPRWELSVVTGNESTEVPVATSTFLNDLPRNRPHGANRMVLHGKHCCNTYTVRPPRSMITCAGDREVMAAGEC